MEPVCATEPKGQRTKGCWNSSSDAVVQNVTLWPVFRVLWIHEVEQLYALGAVMLVNVTGLMLLNFRKQSQPVNQDHATSQNQCPANPLDWAACVQRNGYSAQTNCLTFVGIQTPLS
eukprot:1601545-Amphidinium_carterae.1